MSLLRVRNWLDPVLRKKGERIENIDENLVRLVSDMYETMLEAKGAGLAANQIGEAKACSWWTLASKPASATW